MKKITIWYRKMKNNDEFVLNHIQDGHVNVDKPDSKLPVHEKLWSNGAWKSKHAFIDDKGVIHEDESR